MKTTIKKLILSIKQLLDSDIGYMEWDNYQIIIHDKNIIQFIDKTTRQSYSNILNKERRNKTLLSNGGLFQ